MVKTVKFYNKQTGQWEPIAGISQPGDVDYSEVKNTPDLSVYALKSELEALRQELSALIISNEPNSIYYTEYTIDTPPVSTFSLRRSSSINDGFYLPTFSDGYDYIKLTLKDGKVTTNLDTNPSLVERIKIYYPAETTSIKFTGTLVKNVEHIECSNITDATDMFKDCLVLESADLSTMDSSKVVVSTTMFEGVNNDVQVAFNDEWSYTYRDMGLIKYVEVVMHHYREDGLYENSSIFIKSQYDEHPTQYVIRQVDPLDGRWRYEPLYLECDATYSFYFEDDGNNSETMNACFTSDMDIFFVGATPDSFTDTRPEIGGNEEPEEEYITGFSLGCASVTLEHVGMSKDLPIIPNETGRPMNFVVDTPNSSWSVLSSYYNEGLGCITLDLMSTCAPFEGYVTIRETYSETTQQVYISVQPKVTLTVHYKVTDGDFTYDALEIEGLGTYYFSDDSADDYGLIIQHTVTAYTHYHLRLDTQGPNGPIDLGQINLSNNTEIWISDDSSEILYENPNQEPSEPEEPEEPETPEEPSEEPVTLTLHYYRYLEDYDGWNVRIWSNDNNDVFEYPFNETDDFGRVASFEVTESPSMNLGFNIHNGELFDIEKDRWIDLGKIGEDGKVNVYLLQDEEMVYYTPEVDKTPALGEAHFTDSNSFTIKGIIPFTEENLNNIVVTDLNGSTLSFVDATLDSDSNIITVNLVDDVPKCGYDCYRVEISGFRAPILIQYEKAKVVVHYHYLDSFDWAQFNLRWNDDNVSSHGFDYEDDFGRHTEIINVTAGIEHEYRIYDNNGTTSDLFTFENDGTEHHLWVIQGNSTIYTERPEIGGGDEPTQDYITGFYPHSYDQKITQYGTLQFPIVINEMEKQIDFTAYFEDVTYSNPDALCVTFNTESYDNQWSNDIVCNIAYQGPEAVVGQATLVIKENNSNITERVTVVIQEAVTLKLHYNRTLGDYDYWNVWEWCNDGSHGNTNGKATYFSSTDDYGQIAELKVAKGCNIGYVIRKSTSNDEWEEKDCYMDQYIQVDNDMEVWIIQNQEGYHTERPTELPSIDDYPYYVQYTIDKTDSEDEVGYNYVDSNNNIVYKYIPMLNGGMTIPPKIVVTLNDDTTTEDLMTKVSDVKSIKAYYGSRTSSLRFESSYMYLNEEMTQGDNIPNRIKTLDYINTDNFNSFDGMFSLCTYLQKVSATINTKNAESLSEMFYCCNSLTEIDVSNWDTHNVSNLGGMFAACSSLSSLDLSNWDTRNVTYIRDMFYNSTSIKTLNLAGWNTHNVTNYGDLFYNLDGTTVTISEGLWNLEPFNYGGNNIAYNIIPYDITSINVTTDVEDLTNLNTHKINYTISIQPEANGMFDLETVYDETYIKVGKNTITLLEGAQGKPLSVTFRSKRNNEISQTIEFTLNADYVMPTFDGTIDFTELDPKFPSWMEEYSSGEYTFELGNFMEGVDGLVSNNSNIDDSVATKVYKLTPEEDCYMHIYYRNQSESGCDYLAASITTDEYNISYWNNQFINSSDGDHIDSDVYGETQLTGGDTHYLMLAYIKDSSVSNGVDKACIRSIKFE